jgi:hypothetical protein
MDREVEKRIMQDPSQKSERDILLVLFKEMVEDTTNQLKESLPHLASLVKDQECAR